VIRRVIEWILAGLGAIMCLGGAASIWVPQASSNPPGISLWPMPALLLAEVAILGLVGFFGIVREPRPSSSNWGFLVWITSGCLAGLSILGAIGISVIVLLTVPALAFIMAAILADIRRNRKILPGLGMFLASTVVNFGLFFAIAIIR
jgi:hypothetical protein